MSDENLEYDPLSSARGAYRAETQASSIMQRLGATLAADDAVRKVSRRNDLSASVQRCWTETSHAAKHLAEEAMLPLRKLSAVAFKHEGQEASSSGIF